MKKNISINISGIIFHIEEDGYDSLRKYLDSINKYFSSFEDSSEIMADIESRIAEIFLTKLNEGKQVITAEDVSALITTMGSVNDFKAAEEQAEQPLESENQQSQKKYSPPRQLRRDQKRKILGGVCSGLGSYLNVDPVWIRLLFAILTPAYGTTVIAYIVMWIVVPGSFELDEPEVSKKMFRDPEHKVIAGVSGGVASFLGLDIIAVRILFILLVFGWGFGLLIYIVLWVVLPEAKTLTDKMQMQGEPVTLSNIESNIKKNQRQGESKEETTATKILLLPFRFIGTILRFLGTILIPISEILRVAIGISIGLTGLALLFAVVLVGGVVLGIFSGMSLPVWGPEFNDVGLPVEILSNTFPTLSVVAVLLVAFVPCVYLLLLGMSVVAKRVVFGPTVGWILFAVFFGSLIVVGATVPKIVYEFKKEGEHRVENVFHSTGKKMYIKINEAGLDDYKVTQLELKGYDGKDIKLVQNFQAQGSTKQNAIENAQMVDYHVEFKDSVITFDSNVKFKENAKFRAQRLQQVLYIPYGLPFVLDKDASHFIVQYIDHDDADGNTWKMTSKGLECITCPEKPRHNTHGDLADFDELNITGIVNATIRQGDEYAVELQGAEKDKEKYVIRQDGSTLYIEFDNDDHRSFWKKNFNLKEMRINITMPELSKLEAKGSGTINFSGFQSDNFDIEVLGALKVRGECHTENLVATVNGASELDLRGDSHTMNCTIQGASSLKAYDFEVENATITAHGASHAKVNVTGTLEMTESMASSIDYRGNPDEVIKKD